MSKKLSSSTPRAIQLALGVFLSAASITATPVASQAQQSPQEKSQAQPSELNTLAQELAAKLAKSGRKKIVVLDFRGPNSQWVPLSEWLADQFSVALKGSGRPLSVVDRIELVSAVDALHFSHSDEIVPKNATGLATSVGAEIYVMGSFVAAENGLGITIDIYHVRDVTSGKTFAPAQSVRGKISLTKEVAAHLELPLEALRPKDGIYKSMEGGVSFPICVECPRPDFSEAARAAKTQGTLVLDVLITPAGRATDIKLVKSLGYGLDEQAIEAVRAWKFKPATDVDGKPVAVRAPIEVKFRLY